MNPSSFDPADHAPEYVPEYVPDYVAVAVLSMDDVTVVTVTGEIDTATCPVMAGPVFDHIDAAPAGLVLDLSKIGYLGSKGLAVLLQAQDRARLTDTQLAIVTPEGTPAARILTVSGLAQMLPTYPTLTAAVRTVLANTAHHNA